VVLPLIPLALIVGGTATGGGGLVTGVSGAGKLKTARDRAAAAKARYDLALDRTRRAVDDTNTRVKRYGTEQEDAHRRVVSRMAEFIRRNQRQVEESAARLLDGVEVEISEVPGYGGTMGAGIDWARGVARAGATGAAAYAGIPSAVGALGTASTGTAIGTLSGAARASATLAWLGGGSLASGGGGIALGVTALNVVSVGPTLLIGGLTLNRQGEKALTRAAAYVSEVNTAVARQAAFRSQLLAVDRRIVELSRLLERLVARAERGLDDLESERFDANLHAGRFQTAMRYVIAVRDLVRTPS
jgi:hypothetical protein